MEDLAEIAPFHAALAFVAEGTLKPVDPDAAARLLTGAALNAALWVAAGDDPEGGVPKALEAFQLLAAGLRA